MAGVRRTLAGASPDLPKRAREGRLRVPGRATRSRKSGCAIGGFEQGSVASSSSKEAAARGCDLAGIGSKAREEEGKGVKQPRAHPQRDGEVGGAVQSLGAAQFEEFFSTAGGSSLELASPLMQLGSNWCRETRRDSAAR